jgi:hypothetical protein
MYRGPAGSVGALAGVAVRVLVASSSGEDDDRDGQADDGDHRDREQCAQLPVVGAEHDRGVLGGDCLGHRCRLFLGGRLGGSPVGWGPASGVIVPGTCCGAATPQ